MPLLDTSTYLSQLFWLLISFALLYFLLNKICIPLLQNIFLLREQKIKEALAKASIAQEEALKLKHEYEEILHQAIIAKVELLNEVTQELALEIEKKTALQDLEFAKILAELEDKLANFVAQSGPIVDDIATLSAKNILQELIGLDVKAETLNQALLKLKKSSEAIHA